MQYFTRLPDGREREWDAAALTAAFRDGIIAGTTLVRGGRQDFWYPLAELLGENPTRQLRFPCPECHRMIRSRRIDIGNPVECPGCHAWHTVPDVRRRKRLPQPPNPYHTARSRVILGILLLLIGILPVAYWSLHPRPGFDADRHPFVFTILTYAGLALVIRNWRTFRQGMKSAQP